jgi:hypothetical protein
MLLQLFFYGRPEIVKSDYFVIIDHRIHFALICTLINDSNFWMMCPCFSTLLYAYIRVKSNLPALTVIIQVVAGIHEIWCSNENSILYSCMNAYSRDTKLSVNPPLHLACLQLSGMDIFWSETVMGLMGRIGKPIRVRLGIRLDPFLGIKLVSLYKERTCTVVLVEQAMRISIY